MRLEHKGLGVSAELLDDVRQRHVETYFSVLRELGGENYLDESTVQRLGNFVRAGCRSGILNTFQEDDVNEMKPSAVAWIAQQIDSHIAGFLEIPPE